MEVVSKRKMSHMFMTFFCLIVFNCKIHANNRINRPADPAKRCMNTGMNHERCETIRFRSLELGCITQDEYNTLKKYGSYPSCNPLRGEGLEMLDGWCPCGCFHPDTKIKALYLPENKEQWTRAQELLSKKNDWLLGHWDADTTFDSIETQYSPIRLSTYGKESQPLIVFKTKNNHILKVTSRHPILISTGEMIQAKDVTLKHRLVTDRGEKVKILAINKEKFEGDVVNFSVDTILPVEHIINANGLAVGDQYWQASLEDYYNKVFIRQTNNI